jgi:hypothetical protein
LWLTPLMAVALNDGRGLNEFQQWLYYGCQPHEDSVGRSQNKYGQVAATIVASTSHLALRGTTTFREEPRFGGCALRVSEPRDVLADGSTRLIERARQATAGPAAARRSRPICGPQTLGVGIIVIKP